MTTESDKLKTDYSPLPPDPEMADWVKRLPDGGINDAAGAEAYLAVTREITAKYGHDFKLHFQKGQELRAEWDMKVMSSPGYYEYIKQIGMVHAFNELTAPPKPPKPFTPEEQAKHAFSKDYLSRIKIIATKETKAEETGDKSLKSEADSDFAAVVKDLKNLERVINLPSRSLVKRALHALHLDGLTRK